MRSGCAQALIVGGDHGEARIEPGSQIFPVARGAVGNRRRAMIGNADRAVRPGDDRPATIGRVAGGEEDRARHGDGIAAPHAIGRSIDEAQLVCAARQPQGRGQRGVKGRHLGRGRKLGPCGSAGQKGKDRNACGDRPARAHELHPPGKARAEHPRRAGDEGRQAKAVARIAGIDEIGLVGEVGPE